MKWIRLKANREASVLRFHPWVFSGAVDTSSEDLQDGDWVVVQNAKGKALGTGHFQAGSIYVRLLSFSLQENTQEFWDAKISQALQVRRQSGLFPNAQTDCFRLVHGEGDGLPGLIIDLYGDTAVMQCHSIGMHRDRQYLSQALQTALGGTLKAVYDKSAETLPTQYASSVRNGYLWGKSKPQTVKENGLTFFVDWEGGQKTGFFLDQRDNRALLASFSKDKTVLNAFSYTGGFSVYALQAGAKKVDSLDISPRAVELAEQNAGLNAPDASKHQGMMGDVLQYLKQTETVYDLMVVDPPAFAKSMDKRHNAVQGYKRLNALAIKKIAPGGILFTFSCSQVVDRQLFHDTIVAAAIEAGRQVRILHTLSQPADHPVSIFHPEGAYLKGLVLFVE